MLERSPFSSLTYMPISTDDRARRIAYIRDAMGLTQDEFTAALNAVLKSRDRPPLSRGAVANWEAGKGISRANLSALAAMAESSMDWIDDNSGAAPTKRALAVLGERFLEQLPRRRGGIALPAGIVKVWGQAGAATLDQGALILDDADPIGELPMMPGIERDDTVYGLEVTGTSMLPMYGRGDPLYVSRTRPYRKGDPVVIYEHKSRNGKPVAFLKIFIRETKESVFCEQLNPHLEIAYTKKHGLTVHRVYRDRELIGYAGIER